MDKIIFTGMQFYAYHGVFPEEEQLGQIFIIDLEVFMDLSLAGQSDSLEQTINYAELYKLTKQLMEKERFQLIEAVAEQLASRILNGFNSIQEVIVRVTKPNPPISGYYDHVAVEIRRGR